MDVTGSAKALCVLINKAIKKNLLTSWVQMSFIYSRFLVTKRLGFWKKEVSLKDINSLVDVTGEYLNIKMKK